MLIDVAYVGNKADDLLLVANYNQAAPNNAAGHDSAAARRPIPTFGDITYIFNGGKSRYKAFQIKYEWRMRRDVTILSSLTLSKAKDNGAGALENQNGNFPAPQDFNNLDADYGLSALPPAVQQHDELRLVAAVRPRQTLGRTHRRRGSMPRRRLAAGRHQHASRRRDGDASPTRPARPSRCPASPTTSAAPTTTGRTSPCDPYAPRRPADDHQLVQPVVRAAADRSEPAVRQRAAQQRARAELLAVRRRRQQAGRARRTARMLSSASRRSTCSTA